MSNIRSRVRKKKERIREDKIAGQMLALRQLTCLQATKTIETLLTFLFTSLKKQLPELDYNILNYISIKLVENIKEEKELFEALAKVNYTEGIGHKIQTDIEAFDKFVELAKEYVTIEKCIEIAKEYDEKAEKTSFILEGVKMANTLTHGEEFEIIEK